MNHSEQIKQLSNEILELSEKDNNYTKEDLVNVLLIFRNVLGSVSLKHFKERGVKSKEAIKVLNEFGNLLKERISLLVGSNLIQSDYDILNDEVIS